MSAENVELVRSLLPPPDVDLTEVFQRDADPAAVEAAVAAFEPFLTDDFVSSFQPLGQGERRGAAGLREIWLEWMSPWESYRALSHELIDLGERVLNLAEDVGRRPGMDEEIPLKGSALWTLRDGKIARIDFFARREDAFAAAGVDPPE